MARNPELIRAILRQPDDDTVRLVYADWLDENDDPKHAELIRVQCELAQKTCPPKRRKVLEKREAKLLTDPSFHLPYLRRFHYARGFIDENCTLSLTGKAALFSADFMTNASRSIQSLACELQFPDAAVLDRTLSLKLHLARLPTKCLRWADRFVAACLPRVTELECRKYSLGQAASIGLTAVRHLMKCPHLKGVTSITFDKARLVPLGLIEKLFLSPALPNVTAIHLDGEEWFADSRTTPAEDDHVAEFVARIGVSPKATRLAYLQLNWVIGPKTAQALLDAPHLKPSEQLCVFMNHGLSKATKAALKKKFGKALRM